MENCERAERFVMQAVLLWLFSEDASLAMHVENRCQLEAKKPSNDNRKSKQTHTTTNQLNKNTNSTFVRCQPALQ